MSLHDLKSASDMRLKNAPHTLNEHIYPVLSEPLISIDYITTVGSVQGHFIPLEVHHRYMQVYCYHSNHYYYQSEILVNHMQNDSFSCTTTTTTETA